MIALLLALLHAAPDDERDFRSYLDQAEFFLRKDWYDDAEEQLLKAVAHPDGQHDPLAWYLLATTRLARADVTGAREAAQRAQTNARTIDQAREAESLVAYLAQTYGALELTGPEGTAVRVDLQLQTLLFDSQAQQVAQRVREDGRDKALLPREFGLPAGEWTVNGETVTVSPGETLSMRAPEGGPGALLTRFDRTEIELGVGLAGWLGGPTEGLFPAPRLSAALSFPFGPIDLAVTASWQPQAYTRRDEQVITSPFGGHIGARLGVPLPGLDPWIVRPALTYRLAWIPGIELACQGRGDGWDCAQDGPADLVLYDVGRAHVPGAEVTVARLERRRTFSVGFGVRGGIERAFARLPAQGQAQALSDGSEVRYTTASEARSFAATGWSVSTLVLLAL